MFIIWFQIYSISFIYLFKDMNTSTRSSYRGSNPFLNYKKYLGLLHNRNLSHHFFFS